MGGIESVSTMVGWLALGGRTLKSMGDQFGKRRKVRIVVRPFAKYNYRLLGCGVPLGYSSAYLRAQVIPC